MKSNSRTLLTAACLATLPLTVTLAQTRKPAAKPAAKPVAKPAVKTTTTTTTTTVARPAAASPAPAPAPAPAVGAAAAPAIGAFGVGTNALNVGIGLGNRYGYGGGFFGGSSSVSPAISVSYERGIMPLGPGVLGVGAFVGYQGASYDLGGGDKWKYTDIIVTLRGTFHYPVSEKLDAYGGVGLGVRHAGVSFAGNNIYGSLGTASANDLAAGLFVGGRYFFTPGIGAFAELGYDQTYLKIGLAAKF
jgi:hypothetical protein